MSEAHKQRCRLWFEIEEREKKEGHEKYRMAQITLLSRSSSALLVNILTIWMLKLTLSALGATTRSADMKKADFEAAAKQKQK